MLALLRTPTPSILAAFLSSQCLQSCSCSGPIQPLFLWLLGSMSPERFLALFPVPGMFSDSCLLSWPASWTLVPHCPPGFDLAPSDQSCPLDSNLADLTKIQSCPPASDIAPSGHVSVLISWFWSGSKSPHTSPVTMFLSCLHMLALLLHSSPVTTSSINGSNAESEQ